jgi:hypothetical protein
MTRTLTLADQSAIRGFHLRCMGTPPALPNALPSETLRLQVDGVDAIPQRREFARSVELFETELRPLPAGRDWSQLRRGHLVPSMNGLPTLQERLDRRAYNEYCEPMKDWQEAWDRETVRIDRLSMKIAMHRRLQRASACLAGAVVGLGGLSLFTASIFIPLAAWPVIPVYLTACVLSVALALYQRSKAFPT